MKKERKVCDYMKDTAKKCGRKEVICCTECGDSDTCMDRCYFTLVNGCKIGKYKSK